MIISIHFLTNYTCTEVQFVFHQCSWFRVDPNLSYDKAFKWVIKYLKVIVMQGLILKPNSERGIECSVDEDFVGGWNRAEGADPGLALSRTSDAITYSKGTLLWVSWIQTDILLSTMEAEYIVLSQAIRDALTFVRMMKEIGVVIDLKKCAPKYLCSTLKTRSNSQEITRRWLRSWLIHKCNLVKKNHNKIPSLPEFCCKRGHSAQAHWHKIVSCGHFYKAFGS